MQAIAVKHFKYQNSLPKTLLSYCAVRMYSDSAVSVFFTGDIEHERVGQFGANSFRFIVEAPLLVALVLILIPHDHLGPGIGAAPGHVQHMA